MRKEEAIKKTRKARRSVRIRKKILGNKSRARLTVFRSNKHIYAQIIDDLKGQTIVAASEKELSGNDKMNKTQVAEKVGEMLAERAVKKKVKELVFDKGSYRYHGRVKALAEGARKGGLVF